MKQNPIQKSIIEIGTAFWRLSPLIQQSCITAMNNNTHLSWIKWWKLPRKWQLSSVETLWFPLLFVYKPWVRGWRVSAEAYKQEVIKLTTFGTIPKMHCKLGSSRHSNLETRIMITIKYPLHLVLSLVLTAEITSVAFPSILILLFRLAGRAGFIETVPALFFDRIVNHLPDLWYCMSTLDTLPWL